MSLPVLVNHPRRRVAAVVALASLLLVGVADPARADPIVVGHASGDGWDVTLTQTSGGVLDARLLNTGSTDQTFGLGATTSSSTTVEQLWKSSWLTFADVARATVAAGGDETHSLPLRPGVRYVVYRDIDATPEQILDWTADGRFAPLSVTGDDDSPQLHFGNAVSVAPGTVRAGESPHISVPGFGAATSAEVWLLSEDLARSNLQGFDDRPLGIVHDDGRLLGSVPVDAGIAAGNVTLPAATAPGRFVLLVGNSSDEWWPGGPTYRVDENGESDVSNLVVEAGAPRSSTPVSPTPGAAVSVTPLDQNGATPVSFSFDGGVTAPGTTTVMTSAAGPTPTGFTTLPGSSSYYALETTAQFSGSVTVCVQFDPTGMSAADLESVSLYHYVDGDWTNITTTRTYGSVCGETSSFSPFAVGTPKTGWTFTGFLAPVRNDAVNTEFAGSVLPFRFRLGANRGLKILAAGSPASGLVSSCRISTPPTSVQATTSALPVQLVYVKATKTYWYLWKTDKAWAGTCRQFQLRLADGTVHRATFRFVKLAPPGVLRGPVTPY